ncbi:MAG TPA: hypothetical protein VK007_00440 [Acidimicrobiales bacterium]|nr:hypothetical protein [Acidimicrobiales bacterium]
MHRSDCPRCGRRELRGARTVHSAPTEVGPVLVSTCRGCGAELSIADSAVVRADADLDSVA